MNEIGKLYENAEVKLGCCKYAKYGYEGEEGTWYYCKKEGKECRTYPNGDADCVEKDYPPFTAEKQLELIKWLSSKYGIYLVDKYSIGAGTCIGEFCTKENFEEALAGFINTLWQDLTEEEKEQVKGILNG